MSWYTTGTIAVANGSTTVTGTGTAFVANVQVGFAFLGPDYSVYEVASITNDTALLLTGTGYRGANSSGQPYGIFQTQGIISALSAQVATLLQTFGPLRTALPDILAGVPLAKAWASQLTTTVDGTYYSANQYALNAASSATTASSASSSASSSATSATASATSASTSAGTATTQASNASSSATSASTSATAAATQAGNASTSATSATASAATATAALTSFKNTNYGALSSDPTARPDSSSMQAGDEYFNTAINAIKVYTGLAWIIPNALAAPQSEVFVQGTGAGTFTVGGTSITLANTYGTVNNIKVHFDASYQGVNQLSSLVGKVLTFTSPIPSGITNIFVDGGAYTMVATPASASVGVGQLASDTLGYFANTTSLVSSIGSSLVGWIQTGTGAVRRLLQDKARDTVSIADFGAIGDSTTNNNSFIQLALNSGATEVIVPASGIFAWDGSLTVPSNVTLKNGTLKVLSNTATILLNNSNSILDGVTVLGSINDTQYTNLVNGAASYFSGSSVTTDVNYSPVGTLGSANISGNLLTLGLFTDTGVSTTRVLSSKIPLDATKRYVIDIQKDFVSSGFVASQVNFRAYDVNGNLIVGSSALSVDANGIYQYILPTTYSLGNYLFLDNASFIEVSFAVTRVANQVGGNVCVFDMSKIQVYYLINDLASLSKVSYDNTFVVMLGGVNNTVKRCSFKNLVPTALEANNSVGAKILNNQIYNCLAGINATTTTNTTILGNHVEAYFQGLGQRAFRWKAFGGIDNPGLNVIGNTGIGYFWGFEMINSASLLPNINCTIKGNVAKSISAGFSFSGYVNSTISENSATIGQLGNYLLEFPQTNTGCLVTNNTLNSSCQHRACIGISGVGAYIAGSSNKITNNTIRSTLGIIATIGGTNTVDSYQGTVISGNIINYTATGVFSNIGGIAITNNTLIGGSTGSNDIFQARSALVVNAGSYVYEAVVYHNSIYDLDSYSVYGTAIRWFSVTNNTIKHGSNFCEAISLVPHQYAAMNFSCTLNSFDVLPTSTIPLIQLIGAFYTGSTYNISNNPTSLNGNATPYLSFLSQNNTSITRGSDVLNYTGTSPVTSNAFSFTVDTLKKGFYAVDMTVHNGDHNHSIFTNYVLIAGGGNTYTVNTFTAAQTATCGTVLVTATLSLSSGNIVCSGTTSGSPALVYYIIAIKPITNPVN